MDNKKEGYVTRDGLYKALALTAMAQQGKPISEKALEQFIDSGITATNQLVINNLFLPMKITGNV